MYIQNNPLKAWSNFNRTWYTYEYYLKPEKKNRWWRERGNIKMLEKTNIIVKSVVLLVCRTNRHIPGII